MARGGFVSEAQLYLSGLSIPEISKRTGIPLSTLRFRLKKEGVLRSRAEGVRLAAKAGKLGHMKGTKRFFTPEWRENISKSKKGSGKGLSRKPSGYIEITMGQNKGRGEHVVIMESIIGRPIKKNECVHHIDGNRANNDPINLELMTRSEHARHHAMEFVSSRERNSAGRFI